MTCNGRIYYSWNGIGERLQENYIFNSYDSLINFFRQNYDVFYCDSNSIYAKDKYKIDRIDFNGFKI